MMEGTKNNLTEHSDEELSLQVMNDEYLYTIRNATNLDHILAEYFVFTDKQWTVLQNDLMEEE